MVCTGASIGTPCTRQVSSAVDGLGGLRASVAGRSCQAAWGCGVWRPCCGGLCPLGQASRRAPNRQMAVGAGPGGVEGQLRSHALRRTCVCGVCVGGRGVGAADSSELVQRKGENLALPGGLCALVGVVWTQQACCGWRWAGGLCQPGGGAQLEAAWVCFINFSRGQLCPTRLAVLETCVY